MIYLKEGKTPLNFAYEDEIVQEANSTYQLTFKYPITDPMWESLVEETLLLADDLHGEQEFTIFEVERHHGYVTIFANQVATLLNNYSISALGVKDGNGYQVMRGLVSSIIREHKFTFWSDIAARHTINLKNVTVATALFKDKHSILGQWGGDLVRDKYDIKLLSNGGTEKEALFMYKKNLKTYQQKKSTKDLLTRIHFTAKVKSEKEGEEDKVIKVTVDSPLINKYQNIYEGNLEVSDQDVVDEASLLKYAKQYFKNTLCDILEDNIEIEVIGKPDVPIKIFDTVTVFHEKFNFDVKKKITKYTYSPLGKRLKTVGFGKTQPTLGSALSGMVKDAVVETVEAKLDAFKIQKNLADILKKDRVAIEEKMKDLEEQAKAGVEVKKSLLEESGTVSDITRTKILDAVAADIARLKTIITEAELIKAIQARLNYAEIKTALIDKAFIEELISDQTFRQQFEEGTVNTQNIFTKMKDSIQSSIKKEFLNKEETKKLINDLTINADGIRQITQEETTKIFEEKRDELKGAKRYVHIAYQGMDERGRTAFGFNYTNKMQEVGFAITNRANKPMESSAYRWVRLTNGATRLHLAFANSPDGKLDTSATDSVNKTYVGYYIDNNEAGVSNPERNTQMYTWVRIAEGDKEYTYIRYKDSVNGRITEEPTQNTTYMGIAITNSSTAPTDDSAYKWSKIKGDEADSMKLYIAYADSADGIEGFTHIYSESKKYMGMLTSNQPMPSDDPTDYNWFKIKGENGATIADFNLLMYTDFRGYEAFSTVGDCNPKLIRVDYNNKNSVEVDIRDKTQEEFRGIKLVSSKDTIRKGEKLVVRLPIYIFSDVNTDPGLYLKIRNDFGGDVISFKLDESTPRDKWVVKEFNFVANSNLISRTGDIFYVVAKKNAHFKIAEPYMNIGETLPKDWLPSLDELKPHPLTATLSILGKYEGGVADGIRYQVNVFYDGKWLKEGYKVKLTAKGAGLNFSDVLVSTDIGGYIATDKTPKGKVDGTPLRVEAEISYRFQSVLCGDKLENLPDPKLIEEITTKYKTFESTLERFESKIGEESKKTFRLTYRIPNQCSQSNVEKKGNDLYFAANPTLKANKEYFILADLDDVPVNQMTRIYNALNGGDNKAISNGLNVWRVKYSSDQPNINIYPLGSNTKVKNVEIYEVPEVETRGENIYKANKVAKFGNGNFITITPTERLLGNKIYRVEFKVQTGYSNGQVWKMQYTNNANREAVKKLENGVNTWIFRSFGNQDEIYFEIPNGITVSDVKLFSLDYAIGQKLELNISNIYSEIEQTKNQIKSAVTENNFGTVLTQNAHHLRLAWNNISKFIQFESGGMSFYESGVVNQNKLTARVTDRGYQFWRDGYELGSMGTNSYKHNNNIKGIQFDLEYDGWFMGWAYRESKTNDAYTWKWVYASGAFADYKKDSLNAWCDIDLHGYSLRNGYINPTEFRVEGGVTTDSYDFMLADGRSLTIRFKNGFVLG